MLHRLWLVPVGFLIGTYGTLIGAGGGFVLVPLLQFVRDRGRHHPRPCPGPSLEFPCPYCHGDLAFYANDYVSSGTVVHIATGAFHHGIRRTIALSISVLLGAQLGAFLSRRMGGLWIIRGLAVALGIVGIRILILALA